MAEQLPQWSGRAVRPVTSHGTVHQLYRLGDDLVLRFPLNPGDVEETRAWLRAEADAARSLLGRLPVPSSEPVALGEPGQGYPLPWVVYRWLPGEVPTRGSVALARDLAEVVRALRGIDTGGRRFAGAGRGGVLAEADEYVAAYLDDADGMIDTDALRRLWSRLSRTPRDSEDVWTHGDLMPGNLLVEEGRLAAVIDVGGAGPADPALDLQPAWNLLDDARPGRLPRRGRGGRRRVGPRQGVVARAGDRLPGVLPRHQPADVRDRAPHPGRAARR